MSSEPSLDPSSGLSLSSDEAQLPRGQCRYILLIPELRGQRCACMNFTMSRSMPSATCDCGHLACFHVKDEESPVDKRKVENLKQRLEVLEDRLDGGRHGSLANVITQIRNLEEGAIKEEEDKNQEIRGIYRNLSRIWQSIQQLEARADTIPKAVGMCNARLRVAVAQPDQVHGKMGSKNASWKVMEDHGGDWTLDATRQLQHGQEPKARGMASRSLSSMAAEPWTAHISLLPNASRLFPFERDTVAYKRCLSRGLHRTVVVSGPNAEAFASAVSTTFGHLLQERPWMPLQAKLCAAEQLSGLPMLRHLDPSLLDCCFDLDFLQNHCAVCDARGKIESLYIAMQAGTLPWGALRDAPVYIEGLEDSWAYDSALDQPGPFHNGDGIRICARDSTITASKRTAADLSPITNPGESSPPDGREGPRKLQRTACRSGSLDFQWRAGRASG